MSSVRTCQNYWCDYQTEENITECPKCGQVIQSPETMRFLGGLLAFCGLLLGGAGAALMIFAAPKLKAPAGVTALIWGIFGLLFVVGVSITVAGGYQAATGRRSQSAMKVMVVLLALFLFVIFAVRAFID